MAINLYHKSFISLHDYSSDTIYGLLDLALSLKTKRNNKIKGELLQGKNIAILFEKNSTRTRCAFEVAIAEEGGYSSFINSEFSQVSKKESAEDSAKILRCYYDAISFRGYSQQFAYDLVRHSGIPVYNALTDLEHPTQILADLMTIKEHISHKALNKIKIAYVGDTRNNVANAWIAAATKIGFNFIAIGPKELHPSPSKISELNSEATKNGGLINATENIDEIINADVIYTDCWVSMGEEAKTDERIKLLQKYQVTTEMLKKTKNDNVLFMHCLPAFHDLETEVAQDNYNKGLNICEVTDEVFRSRHSVVFQQAENRLHTIKALLVATLNDKYA